MSILHTLAKIIDTRSGATGKANEASYTAQLLASGVDGCAQKFGEEAVEAVIAASRGDKKELTAEAADVLFHLLVMLKAGGVTLDEVLAELERRTAQSGLQEKAGRSPKR